MSKKYRWCAAMAVACGAVASSAALVHAQAAAPAAAPAAAVVDTNYETMPLIDAIYKDGKPTPATTKIETIVRDIVSGRQQLAQNEASFDRYFTMYLFPLMTQTDDKNLARLPRDRTNFVRNYLQLVKTPEVHDHMVRLTFNSMKDIVTKNYHPAVRYNAMLIIGELNTKEPAFSGAATLPVPFAEALPFMVAQHNDPNQIEAVRVAALLGILRHADLAGHNPQLFTPAIRQGLTKQILPLATDKKVPAGRSDEGHAWMRARAVEVVGALGQAAYDAAIVQALSNIVGDATEPMDVRFNAAAALGRIDLRTAPNTAGDEIARRIADLAIEGAREELAILDAKILAEKEKLKAQGGGSISGRGERYVPSSSSSSSESGISGLTRSSTGEYYGEIPVAVVKEEQRIFLLQRQLKDRMIKSRFGIEGYEGKTGAVSKPGQANYIKSVSSALLQLQKIADLKDAKIPDRAINYLELAKALRTKITEVEKIAKAGGIPAPAARPAAPVAPEGPEGPEGPDAAAPMPAAKAAAPAVAPANELPEDPAAPAAPMAKKAPANEVP